MTVEVGSIYVYHLDKILRIQNSLFKEEFDRGR